jgi:DNA-binding response OmpR family regulator
MDVNRETLKEHGYRIIEAETISQCREVLEKESPDLILLDVLLPDGDGLSFCEELRSQASDAAHVPILFLSALDEKEEVIAGLKAGGDDYLSKPYDIFELVTRIESLLRRVRYADEGAEKRMNADVICGPITISKVEGRAYINGKDLTLHKKEFELLNIFIQRKDEPIAIDELYEKIWSMSLCNDTQALRSAVSRLRTGIAGSGYAIIKERGGGYCFLEEV